MQIAFTEKAWDNYIYWQATDSEIVEKINALIKEIKRDPFKGIGRPEPLRRNFAGAWSRRITAEHRLVYEVSGARPNQTITILQARFHY
jgi:toxin YoeB